MMEQPERRPMNDAGSRSPADRNRNRLAEQIPMDAAIEDYLDHVCAPLVEVVPYARRRELRAELAGHLEALVSGYQELEPDAPTAVQAALRQFGDPRRLAGRLAREWAPKRSSGGVRRATLTALALFGPAALLSLASLFWWDVAELNGDGSFPMAAWGLECLKVAFVAPLIAGLLTGLLAPVRAAFGTFLALALLILPSAALSHFGQIPELGHRLMCGTLLAIIQAVVWIPLGCGAAALGAFLQNRRSPSPGRWVLQ